MPTLTRSRPSSRTSSLLSKVARDFAGKHGIALDGADTKFDAFRFDPAGYVREYLKWSPAGGTLEHPGQMQIIDAYTLALRQQHEKEAYENGALTRKQLEHWQPGVPIQNWIRVEAGHTVGKTKIAAGLVNHFFDCFIPSIIYSFAPGELQLKTLLWKEIKADRVRDARLPGRIGALSITDPTRPDHFAIGRVANDSEGRGTERVHGQHNRYLMFVLDEAEGIPDFVFDAVESMMGGGIGIVLMIANPKTRASRFYRERRSSRTANFRISCLWHPNVLAGKEIVPNAVRRQYVERMIESGLNDRGMTTVPEHDADAFTFDLPYPVQANGRVLEPGVIFRPDHEFLWRVMGIAPLTAADKTLISPARYEAARARLRVMTKANVESVRIGVDVARYGNDYGTVWVCHAGQAYRSAQLFHADTNVYVDRVLQAARTAAKQGGTDLSVRIDGTGGFGAGLIDRLKGNLELRDQYHTVAVHEVIFGSRATSPMKYADRITELYAETNESILHLAIPAAPNELEVDLTEREAEFVNRGGEDVRKLEQKEKYRKRYGHSPDDGDGFVLAVNPESLFPTAVSGEVSRSYSTWG